MKQRAAWLLSLLWQIVVCCPIALVIIPRTASAHKQSETPSITPATQKLPDPVSSLAVDPHDGRVAYALLVTNALYRTSDTGRTWQKLPLPALEEHFNLPSDPERRNFVSFPPQQNIWLTPGGRLFVWAALCLYRSEDGGSTWRFLQDQINAWAAADPTGNVLYVWRSGNVAKEYGLYRSDDSGDSWKHVYIGFFPPFLQPQTFAPNHEGVTVLLADPLHPSILYAGTDFGIFRSKNGGTTWEEFTAGLPSTQRTYRWVPLLVAAPDGTIYALTNFSSDGYSERYILGRLRPGEGTWEIIGSEALAPYLDSRDGMTKFYSLVPDPVQPGRLYAGTDSGLLVSANAGEAWKLADLPGIRDVFRIAVSRSKPPLFYLWTDVGVKIASLSAPR